VPMRLAAALALLALIAALATGCGSSGSSTSSESTARPKQSRPKGPAGASVRSCAARSAGAWALRVTTVSCAEGHRVARAWRGRAACAAPSGASRTSCAVGRYRCLGVMTPRGLEISCARPGRSVAFLVRRG